MAIVTNVNLDEIAEAASELASETIKVFNSIYESELVSYRNENGAKEKVVYVGSLLDILPSGKFYTMWTKNHVSQEEVLKDGVFWEHFEHDLAQEGITYFLGDDDPDSVFAVKQVE